jgi:tRNA dimethylallyltransferase
VTSLPRVVAVVGPTASGKSSLGVAIAQRLEQPVLVCDSVKIYRGLDIGSAKPTAAERAAVPHHLFDLVEPDATFSAGDYARLASTQLAQTGGVFVGGTGFYLRAAGWTSTGETGPEAAAGVGDPGFAQFDARWRAAERDEPGVTHRALGAHDPRAAASVHPNNLVRVIRALWLCERFGRPVSEVRREDPPRPRLRMMLLVLDPDPEELRSRIATRLDAMLDAGWVDEVERLWRAGYDESHKSMRSLGYRQLLDVVRGDCDLSQAREKILAATWQYARRQRTYFRHQLPAEVVVHLRHPSDCPWDPIDAFIRDEREGSEAQPSPSEDSR